MNLGQIGAAYSSLIKLSQINMDYNTAYRLHQLVEAVKSDFDFYMKKEYEILKQYGVPNEKNPTNFYFSEENREIAQKELTDLKNIEITADITPVNIYITDDLKLSASDIGVLMPFINFIEKGNNTNGYNNSSVK